MEAISLGVSPKRVFREQTNAELLVAWAYLNLSVVDVLERNFASAYHDFENSKTSIRQNLAHGCRQLGTGRIVRFPHVR